MLLTRSRLGPGPKSGSSLHLHVLGTPPAFVLSQDQTLREELHTKSRQEFANRRRRQPRCGGQRRSASRVRPWWDRTLAPIHAAGWPVQSVPLSQRENGTGRPSVHEWGRRAQDGVNLGTVASAQNSERSPRRGTASNLDTQSRSRVRSMSVHAVEFSKTAAPPREDRSLRSAPRPDKPILGQTAEYSARIRSRGLDLLSKTGPAPGGRSAVDQDRTSTSTVRSRGRSSKSNRTICCQVPSARRPPITGIDSDGPITAARRCACALVS